MEQTTTRSNVVTNPPVQPRPTNAPPDEPPSQDDDDGLLFLFGCGALLITAFIIGITMAAIMLAHGTGIGGAALGFIVGFLGTLIGVAQALGESTTTSGDEKPRVVTQPMPLHAKVKAEREGVDPSALVDQMTTPATNGRNARVHVVRMPGGGYAVVTSDPNGPQRTPGRPGRMNGKENSHD